MNTAVGHQLRVLLLEDNPGDVRLVREYFKEARGSVLLIDHEETLAQARDLLGLDAYDAAQIDLSVDDSESRAGADQTL